MRHQPRIPNNGTGCSRAFPLTSRVITGASWPLLSIGASILSGHTLQWGQRSHALEGDRVMEEQRSGCQDELMYLERPASCAPDDEACRARLPAARERVRRRHRGTGDSPCLRHRPIAHPRHALSFPASTGSEVLRGSVHRSPNSQLLRPLQSSLHPCSLCRTQHCGASC